MKALSFIVKILVALVIFVLILFSLQNFVGLSILSPEYARYGGSKLLTGNYVFSILGILWAVGLLFFVFIKKNINTVVKLIIFGIGVLLSVYLAFMNYKFYGQVEKLKTSPDYIKYLVEYSSLSKNALVEEGNKLEGDSKDSLVFSDMTMFWNALERYKYKFNKYPEDLTVTKPLSQLTATVNDMINNENLSPDFKTKDDLNLIFVSLDASGKTRFCFLPTGEELKNEANQTSLGVSGQHSSCVSTGSCYYCIPKNQQ